MQNAIKSIISIDKEAEKLKMQKEEELKSKKREAEEKVKLLWKKTDEEILKIKEEIISKNKLEEKAIIASIEKELEEKEKKFKNKYEKIKNKVVKDAIENIVALTKEE
ncbi:ElaB/YqjD/DUF883 family membrane-anchored ribosome-binding protein [Clostridium pascui]|uniref:hypothetical protein n=1 Tax=Clostridium pascui TaxID=46609 RepID=UPI00195678C4|nr:hypothetical protein [Clostridium pascui]MBM7870006.1 ElaB/YqjD/DUF883 family membrane-anchored ribosome-binding protein [Clostridium pascui]